MNICNESWRLSLCSVDVGGRAAATSNCTGICVENYTRISAQTMSRTSEHVSLTAVWHGAQARANSKATWSSKCKTARLSKNTLENKFRIHSLRSALQQHIWGSELARIVGKQLKQQCSNKAYSKIGEHLTRKTILKSSAKALYRKTTTLKES